MGVELLSAEGVVATVPYEEIKIISFVRDWAETGSAERRLFQTRPKMAGLWVSFVFRDGDRMEGVMPNNLLQVEGYGFSAIPPDSYGNQQRIFVPRQALNWVEVLGVVGSSVKRRKPQPAPKEQIGLFDEP